MGDYCFEPFKNHTRIIITNLNGSDLIASQFNAKSRKSRWRFTIL